MKAVIFSKFRVLLLLLVLFVIWQSIRILSWTRSPKVVLSSSNHGSSDTSPASVIVFYEALCPDSKNFIAKQLLPTIKKAPKLINVTLVPYGKAKTEERKNGDIVFSCQHGTMECFANKIHACAIFKIADSLLQVKYISCMISDNMFPELIAEKCAKEFGIDSTSILNCANSDKGSILLKSHGILTDALVPKISFVPTILLDNKQNNQAAILKDFFKEVCLIFENKRPECSPIH